MHEERKFSDLITHIPLVSTRLERFLHKRADIPFILPMSAGEIYSEVERKEQIKDILSTRPITMRSLMKEIR